MELRELNNQAPIQMNGGPIIGHPLNTNYNLNNATQQQQMQLVANQHQQLNNHSIAPPMRPPVNGQAARYQTNGGTNNNGTNQQNGTSISGVPKISTKHRELPVDVPDSFVGMAKQSPRYPPPKLQRQISPPMSLNNNQFTPFSQNTNPATGPNANHPSVFNQQQQHSTTNNRNGSINGTSNIKNPSTIHHQQPQVPPIAQSAATSIMTHNSSLRSSIKLKQLEKSRNQHANGYPGPIMQPSINQGFELNEDDDGETPVNNLDKTNHVNQNQICNNNHLKQTMEHHQNQQHLHQQQQQHQNDHLQQQAQQLSNNQNMNDICSLYNRLQNDLNGDFADVAVDGKLAKLLSIYNTIIQTHDKQFKIPSLTSRFHINTTNGQKNQEPFSYKLSDLLYTVQRVLETQENSPIACDDATELLSILRKHEMDGVCSAFDRIVQSFEYAKLSPSPSPQLESTRLDINNGFQDTTTTTTNNNSNTNNQHQQINSSLSTLPVNQIHNQFNNHNTNNNININDNNGPESGYYLNEYTNFGADNIHMDIENNLYHNGMHPMTEIDLSDGGCTKTVHIDKGTNQRIGATIKNDGNRVIVNRIVCGGVAHNSGVLNEGDEILEVNGIPMHGKNIDNVVPIIESLNGTLTFTIITPKCSRQPRTNLREKIFVRAFFDFDGETETFNPCKELGLSFKKGEILSIIDQSDEIWWQAMREHDSDSSLAGLIPSLKFLNQRENHLSNHDSVPNYLNMKHEKKNFWSKLINCPKAGTTPRKRRELHNMPFGPDQIPYYEEVYTYYPDKYRQRPIILVGPKMIGQREMVAKLLQDSNRFGSAVSHTSRPRQDHERNGVDFHFVTRAQFEADMKLGKFIECGQYQNQYYGTSLEAMREVVRSKKICVHLVNTPSIFNFRHGRAGSELRPYFVFVKPDDHPDKLRNIVATYSQPKSNIEENIRAILDEVQLIETYYMPYFDFVLTVSNVDRAYQELLAEIDKVEREPQWIPAFWKNPT